MQPDDEIEARRVAGLPVCAGRNNALSVIAMTALKPIPGNERRDVPASCSRYFFSNRAAMIASQVEMRMSIIASRIRINVRSPADRAPLGFGSGEGIKPPRRRLARS
jgi:hypothetical protein